MNHLEDILASENFNWTNDSDLCRNNSHYWNRRPKPFSITLVWLHTNISYTS